MVDTTAHRTALNTLFNDNSSGDITAGDMRQGMVNILDDIDTLNGETLKMAINAQTGTAYTLVAADSGKVVTMNNAAASTLTLPNNLPVGFTVTIVQIGAGKVTVAAGSGATVNSRGSVLGFAGRYSAVTITVYANGTGTAATAFLSGDVA